jgi:hypothetical protein
MGDLGKEESRDRRSGNDLETGSRDATARSTRDYIKRLFANFPLISAARPKSRGG